MFFKKENFFNRNSKNNKSNKLNHLKKYNVYIKHYKYLNNNQKITKLHTKKYYNLKKKFNIKSNLTSNYKYITKKLMYIFKKATKEGTLKILNWKEKLVKFNFFYNENLKDRKVYEFWNMKPSYLKYIYSKINRKHEYKNIYNLCYRSLLVYPYIIKVKPYTIIIRNFFVKNFLLIFEWKSKINKNIIIAKTAIRFNKILKFKFFKNINYNYNNIYKKLSIFKMNINKINKSFRINSKTFINKKIKYLFWKHENWIWRYRNNWVFTNLRKDFSLNYQYFLLKMFKSRILKKFNYNQLPSEIFIEKFENILYKKLIYYKNKYIILKNKYRKSYSNKANKIMFYKYKSLITSKLSLKVYKFYSNMYYLYYYWFILLLQKIYEYINKIMFNLYLNFLHISNYDNINTNYCFVLFFNKLKQLDNLNILNIDSKIIYIFKHIYRNNIYMNKLFKFDFYIQRKEIINSLNRITSNKYKFNFFKNLQYIYTTNIFNVINNNKINLLLDYVQDNIYMINICFKKYYIQTSRAINYNLNEKINKVSKYMYNDEFINLNKYNLNNSDFLNINIKNIYLDNIHWNKINYNQNNLGYILNLNDLCYKNYEININEDKRFYYI